MILSHPIVWGDPSCRRKKSAQFSDLLRNCVMGNLKKKIYLEIRKEKEVAQVWTIKKSNLKDLKKLWVSPACQRHSKDSEGSSSASKVEIPTANGHRVQHLHQSLLIQGILWAISSVHSWFLKQYIVLKNWNGLCMEGKCSSESKLPWGTLMDGLLEIALSVTSILGSALECLHPKPVQMDYLFLYLNFMASKRCQ